MYIWVGLGPRASACLNMFSFQLNSVKILSQIIINVIDILHIFLMEESICATVGLVRKGQGVSLAMKLT